MTASLSDVAVQMFQDEFMAVYQAKRQLGGTVRTRANVVGDAYIWKLIGTTEMQVRGAPQSLVPASDVSHTPITTPLVAYVLNLPTDIFQQAEVNADERSELANVHAMAAGRRQDQFIIDALNGSSGTVIADGGTNLTKDKLIETAEKMNIENVPNSMRHFAISAQGLSSLLKDPEITSTDYNSIRALMTGEINTFMGFKMHVFGTLGTGGLPLAGNIRTCFAWNQMAVGEAYNVNPSVRVDYSVERTSWIAVGQLSGGATALQDAGIVKVEIDESV